MDPEDSSIRPRYLDPSRKWEQLREDNKKCIQNRKTIEQKVHDYVTELHMQIHEENKSEEINPKPRDCGQWRPSIYEHTASSLMKVSKTKNMENTHDENRRKSHIGRVPIVKEEENRAELDSAPAIYETERTMPSRTNETLEGLTPNHLDAEVPSESIPEEEHKERGSSHYVYTRVEEMTREEEPKGMTDAPITENVGYIENKEIPAHPVFNSAPVKSNSLLMTIGSILEEDYIESEKVSCIENGESSTNYNAMDAEESLSVCRDENKQMSTECVLEPSKTHVVHRPSDVPAQKDFSRHSGITAPGKLPSMSPNTRAKNLSKALERVRLLPQKHERSSSQGEQAESSEDKGKHGLNSPAKVHESAERKEANTTTDEGESTADEPAKMESTRSTKTSAEERLRRVMENRRPSQVMARSRMEQLMTRIEGSQQVKKTMEAPEQSESES